MTPPRTQIPKIPRGNIVNFKGRQLWQAVFARDATVWAFYNNGVNLYVDPRNLPANTFYRHPWRHLPYSTYVQPNILISHEGKGRRHLTVQTMGHDIFGVAILMLNQDTKQMYTIPPKHILYVAIKNDVSGVCNRKIESTLIQSQYLPFDIAPYKYGFLR